MKNKLIFPLLVGALLVCACNQKKTEVQSEVALVATPNSFPVNFSPYAPKDLDSLASDSLLVKFAWEEFLALNWKSSYPSNGLRDTPDTSWNWTSGDPDLAVWETYAHRTELRPYDDKMLAFDTSPHYSFGVPLTPAEPGYSLQLFNNLDENNEIGSCNLYAHANIYGEENMVLYQAKANREEYDYVYNNYPTKAQLLKAQTDSLISLPAGGDQLPNGSLREGAIEIKTAWRLLVKEDDSTRFFRRKAIYFTEDNGKVLYHNDTFALIGMHIIHKTKQRPDFVFATWEHVDVEKDSMAYVLLDAKGRETGGLVKNYKRFVQIPELVNRANDGVHEQIRAMNPNSIWQNYRLVGVQGKPTNDQSSFSYFLANFVIESDPALADFHGSGIGSPHDNGVNTSLNGKEYTMGGCMGCHGVAQRKLKTDFSFLLDTIGKPVKSPDLLDHIPPNGISKLQRYINALQ